MSFQAVQAMEMEQFGHLVIDRETGRCLGGAGRSFYKVWAFPLYTPSGITVIQEFAFDHPFHNGFFVGQYPVRLNGRDSNFWAAPPRRSADDPVFQAIGRVDASPPTIELQENGARFVFNCVWRDEDEAPVLDEVRTITFRASEDATICDMTSGKTASYGDVEFPQTKMGAIGVRVEPRLLPPLGGVILADNARRGNSDVVHEQDSKYVAYESFDSRENCFGICLTILDAEACGPWFVRDYGMAIYNPTWREGFTLPAGKSCSVGLRAVAYDGQLTEERAHDWRSRLR